MGLPDPTAWPVDEPLGNDAGDLLRERAQSTPNATALVDTDADRSWSYGEFDDRVDEWAAGLSDRVDLRDSRIGLLLPTGVEFATAYFAVARRDGTVVPLNLREATDTVTEQARRANVTAIVACAETEATATAVAPPGASVLSVDEPRSESVDGIEPTAGRVTAVAPDDATERLILFTSGTTGEPKGVRLTRENLVASAVGSAHRLGVAREDRWLVVLPMYHMGGLAPLVRSTLYGTTTVLRGSFDADDAAALIADRGVTGVSLVPTMLRRLLDDGWDPPAALRFVLVGGAPARAELIERCEDAGVPVYPTYGATETASQITTATPAEAFDAPETVGRPLRGTTVTVLGDGGPKSTGELVVSGPTVTPGYLDEGQTADAFDERGFHTGDVGYRDGDGRFYVVGRVDDRIVTGGENVQPATVERALEGQSGVAAAAVVGLPDEEWGERVVAAVVPSRDGVTAGAVVEAARTDLADFAVPKTVALVESLPRTASGTVDRERVRELVGATDGS